MITEGTLGKVCMTGVAALATIDLTAVPWERMSTAGLAIVACIYLYRDGNKRQDKQEKIIESNTQSNQKLADTLAVHSLAIDRNTNAVEKCHGARG